MADVTLGINTGFALNRYPEPEEWIRVVGEELGLRVVQLTADLLNPSLPAKILSAQVKKINRLSREYGVEIRSTMTGAFTRVNHLSHPDPDIRKYWLDWFKSFVDLTADLGAESLCSHFGIMTTRDVADPRRRAAVFRQTVDGWRAIAAFAKRRGLKFLAWEPMSVPREYGETIAEARRVQNAFRRNMPLPMKMCLDVDHGDVSSRNKRDTDPYAWIRAFGKESPFIHLKQSSANKGGHWPFTPERNAEGRIRPEKILRAIDDSGAKEALLLFEFSFREREPFESRVVSDLKASVNYWRPHVRI